MNTSNIREPQIDVNIMIAIPSNDQWSCQFGMALAGLLFHYAQVPVLPNVRKQQVVLLNRRSSMLSQSRETLFDEALERNCTHILWLDSDMVFPADTIHKLIKHNRTFVGANYVRKIIPASPVSVGLDGHLLFTDENSTGIEPALHIGFGVCLMRMEDLKEMEAPRFSMSWNEELKAYSGEDVFFCQKMRDLGLPTYVDHDLSCEVEHVGSFNFDHSVVGTIREVVDAAVDGEEQRLISIKEANDA